MSDYQSCVVREIVGPRECVIEATLCHADALLPLPDDHPTLLRMIAEGCDRKKMPALRPALDTFSDSAIIARASEVIEGAEVEWSGANDRMNDASAYGAMARYRVRFREDLDWSGIKVGGGWGAAADLFPPRQQTPMTHEHLFLDRGSRSPKRLPPGESVARLGELLASRPQQVGGFARLLGSHDELGAPFAPLLAEALYLWPECLQVALALGRIGAPASIGPLVLALWQGKSHRLRNENVSLEEQILTALGWYGPRARPLAESYLRSDRPLTTALCFARWRVLGDEEAMEAFVSGPLPGTEEPMDWEDAVSQAVFKGPRRPARELIEAVRPRLGDKSLGDTPFETLELWHQRELAKLDAEAKGTGAKKSVAKKAPATGAKKATAKPTSRPRKARDT